MSQTRRAIAGSELRQERFSSSTALNRGLLGNLVARRCETLRSSEERSLVYFLHELSLRDGYAIHRTCNLFPSWPWPSSAIRPETSFERVARELTEMFLGDFGNPRTRDAVRRGLPNFLVRLCLDPSLRVEPGSFPSWEPLIERLRGYERRFCSAIKERIAETEVTRTIFEALDYAQAQRGIVLLEGKFRIGKSLSAQAYCQTHLGEARYVQLSSATSDVGFFRDIARSLGVSCSNQRKALELRARVEDSLRGQHLLLVIDEADWLWPQAVRPQGSPERINWLMTSVVNNGVPVALIASQNFSRMMFNLERKCPIWGSEQLRGRIKLRKPLPNGLAKEDLLGIARVLLPSADHRTLLLLVGHALLSDGRVAEMESAALRAKFFADRAGHNVGYQDVESALAECSDGRSLEVLNQAKQLNRGLSAKARPATRGRFAAAADRNASGALLSASQ